jgi:hypothetical protein
MEQLAGIAKKIGGPDVTQTVIDTTGSDSLLINATNTIAGAGSIELPRAGEFDYSDIQSYVQNIFLGDSMQKENASIQVENGSGVTGQAAQVADSLEAASLNVSTPVNAPADYADTVIYDYTGGKDPYTIKYLESKFGVQATLATAPVPATAGGYVPDIRIILGSSYQSTKTAN